MKVLSLLMMVIAGGGIGWMSSKVGMKENGWIIFLLFFLGIFGTMLRCLAHV